MTKRKANNSSPSTLDRAQLANATGGSVRLEDYRSAFITLGVRQPVDRPDSVHVSSLDFVQISHNR